MSEVREKYKVKRKRESWPIVVAQKEIVHRRGEGSQFSSVSDAVAWVEGNLAPGEYQLIRLCPKKLVVRESTKKVVAFEGPTVSKAEAI